MAVLSAPIHHLDSCTPIRTDPGSTSLLKKQASSILESNQTYSVTNSPTPSPQGPNGFLSCTYSLLVSSLIGSIKHEADINAEVTACRRPLLLAQRARACRLQA
jgi:hypothetical protein